MANRWTLVESEGRWTVNRNGSWYSDVDDEEDGIGLLRNQRAGTVVIMREDDSVETRKL